jgi:ADP-sugar diphosphatase
MTDKLRLIDAEIASCRSKMMELGGGRGGVLLRAADSGVQHPHIMPGSAFYKPLRLTYDTNEKSFTDIFGTVIPTKFNAEITGTPIYFKTTDDLKHQDKLKNCGYFNEWVQSTCRNYTVNAIVIQSLDWFGPARGMGFIKLKADVEDEEQIKIPAIVFMRGGSVAILILVECDDGKIYTVLTHQARIPVGKYTYEIPAGMLDNDGNFGGKAAEEVKEETGIQINVKDLLNLNEIVYGSDNRIYPSCGGCDEYMKIFLYKTNMTVAEKDKLDNKNRGNGDEGEKIKVKFIPFHELTRSAPDMKALSALALYNAIIEANKRKENDLSQYIHGEKKST